MPKAPPKLRRTTAPQPKRVDWGTTKGKRITGRRLQRERERLFADDSLCVECRKRGRVTVATIRDHKLALAFGGTDTAENTQGLCTDCHDAKSKAEAAEGVRRPRFGEAHPIWLPRPAIPVTIISGPAGAGKSTYAKAHAKPSDIIIDFDEINLEMTGRHGHQRQPDDIRRTLDERNQRLAALSHAKHGRCWFIVGAPTERERQWWKDKLGAEVVLLDPGLEVCVERIGDSLTRRTAAEYWYHRRVMNWYPPEVQRPRLEE